MRHLLFTMAGFALMLFSVDLHAQAPQQGGMDTRPGTEKPQISAKAGATRVKHEKMETRGNDVKLERSSRVAKGDADMPKEKPKSDAKKEKKSAK
jgi:hypothetical protein